ncbi:MAG: phosphatase [Cyclobacteriaceae bacterium]|nr:phosphatase [Cyclobacteriaceae bacterium]
MAEKDSNRDIQGEIITDPETFVKKLKHVKALVFDWDGIFNNGVKGHIPSTYNEIDSMGINMLRFGYFLLQNRNPVTAIVTGERSETAVRWAEREHFHAVYLKVKNKIDILHMLETEHPIQRDEILFVFDDIHDLSLAVECGVRFLVPNPGAKMLAGFCRKMNYCDYISKNSGGENALREISETVLNLLDLFDKTIQHRIEFAGIYYDYWKIRNGVETNIVEMSY